ncbi:MAG: cytochrome c [Anaerolineae bacterium]|nr:cytochrome c [Anaerolineae bacterium]
MILLVLILSALLVAACSQTPASESVIAPAVEGSETWNTGQTIYNLQCSTCHGINGEGQFPDAPLEKDITGRYGAPPHNETGHTWHHDDDLIIRIIKEGGMGDPVNFYVMPALGSVLSDTEIEAVIAYIKTMWTSEQQDIQRERTIAVWEQQ